MASGAQWVAASAVGEKLIGFAATVVLARLLVPEEFGLFALAFVAMDALGALKNLGLDAAIVQRRDRVEQAADAAFLLLPAVSTGLFLLLLLAAPVVAGWLGTPKVAGPLRGLAFALVIVSLGAVPNALQQKSMRFRERVTATLLGAVAGSVVAIVLALAGWGVWGLVAAYLLRTTVTSGVCWLQVEWRPHMRFDRPLLSEMLGFSKYVVAANLLSAVAGSVDKVVVGRLLGPAAVGFYSLAYGLAFVFRGEVGPRLYQVAFPAFAEVQDDRERLQRGVRRVVQVLLSVALPFAVLIGLLSRDALAVAYGTRWTVAAPVLTALAVGGAFSGLATGLYPLLLARGRSKALLFLNVGELAIFLCVAPWAIARAGLVGAGAATAISVGASTVIKAAVVSRDLSMGWHDWVRAARSPLLAAATMAAAALVAKTLIGVAVLGLTPLWNVATVGGIAIVVYCVVLWASDAEMTRWLAAWLIGPLRRMFGGQVPAASHSERMS